MASYHFIILLIASFWLALCPAMVLAQVASVSSTLPSSTAIASSSDAPQPSSSSAAPTSQASSGAQSTPPITSPLSSSKGVPTASVPGNSSTTRTATLPDLTPDYKNPDVILRVPNLSVQRIELDVDNLKADINLNAKVANLVSINVGVAVGVEKINITIADIQVQLELIVRLGHLVDIVQRVFETLDLNPLLITALNTVTQVVDTVIVGVVDGLLGTLTKGNTTLNFIIDNLGNIVSNVVGEATGALGQIVGNFQNNMTDTGASSNVGNGLTQKYFTYTPLSACVGIVFDSNSNVVQATNVKSGCPASKTSSTTSLATGSMTMTLPPATSATPTGEPVPSSSAPAASSSSAAP